MSDLRMSSGASLQVMPTLMVIVFISVSIYRLTFHPLAKVPGPFVRKLSGWPEHFSAVRGRRHIDHYRLHCRYGPRVRLTPSTISFSTITAFNDIHRGGNVTKSGWLGFLRDISPSTSLQMIEEKTAHAQRRRLIGTAFSDASLKNAEEFMLQRIRAWSRALLSKSQDQAANGSPEVDQWSEGKDMGHWCALLALDVLGELCFGKTFGAIENVGHEVLSTTDTQARLGQKLAYMPMNYLFKPVLGSLQLTRLISKEFHNKRWRHRALMLGLIEERHKLEVSEEKNDESRRDFFHYLFEAKDPETGATLQLSQLVGEAALLVGAGSDTSATAMSACLFYLNRDPSKLQQLSAELRDAFDDVEDIRSGPKLSSLHYLRACIDEAMRMNPPVPGSLTREALPGGALVEGDTFPAGTKLEVAMYTISHNEEYFPDPFTYLPERWIAGSTAPLFDVTETHVATARAAFVPFSTGSRNCIGKSMAYMEMTLTLARLMWQYDMRFSRTETNGACVPSSLSPGRERQTEYYTEDWFITASKTGPYLQFKPSQKAKASAATIAS